MTRYSRVVAAAAGADRPLDQLDEPADAVLLVHHEVARCAAASGSTTLRRRDGIVRMSRVDDARAAGQVGLGEDGEPQVARHEPAARRAPG